MNQSIGERLIRPVSSSDVVVSQSICRLAIRGSSYSELMKVLGNIIKHVADSYYSQQQ